MRIEIYKTCDIPFYYWKDIINGFNASFQRENTKVEQLKIGYESNFFGYSYHALYLTDDDKVVGFYTIIPNYYTYKDNEKVKIGLGGTVFVLKEYRKNIFMFRDMYIALKAHCKKEDFIAILGVSNNNAYEYSIKILKKKYILSLPYYIFPKNAFNVLSDGKYSLLNFLSRIFVLLNLFSNYLLSYIYNPIESIAKYRILQNETYFSKRFQNKKYRTKNIGDFSFTYVIYKEDNIITIYLMHFAEKDKKSYRALVKAIYYIYIYEKFDLILYIGTMNLKQFLLLKVPRSFEPKNLPLTYSILDKNRMKIYDDMGFGENWDFSLLNLDVR